MEGLVSTVASSAGSTLANSAVKTAATAAVNSVASSLLSTDSDNSSSRPSNSRNPTAPLANLIMSSGGSSLRFKLQGKHITDAIEAYLMCFPRDEWPQLNILSTRASNQNKLSVFFKGRKFRNMLELPDLRTRTVYNAVDASITDFFLDKQIEDDGIDHSKPIESPKSFMLLVLPIIVDTLASLPDNHENIQLREKGFGGLQKFCKLMNPIIENYYQKEYWFKHVDIEKFIKSLPRLVSLFSIERNQSHRVVQIDKIIDELMRPMSAAIVNLQKILITLMAPTYTGFIYPPSILGMAIKTSVVDMRYSQHKHYVFSTMDGPVAALINHTEQLCGDFYRYTQSLLKKPSLYEVSQDGVDVEKIANLKRWEEIIGSLRGVLDHFAACHDIFISDLKSEEHTTEQSSALTTQNAGHSDFSARGRMTITREEYPHVSEGVFSRFVKVLRGYQKSREKIKKKNRRKVKKGHLVGAFPLGLNQATISASFLYQYNQIIVDVGMLFHKFLLFYNASRSLAFFAHHLPAVAVQSPQVSDFCQHGFQLLEVLQSFVRKLNGFACDEALQHFPELRSISRMDRYTSDPWLPLQIKAMRLHLQQATEATTRDTTSESLGILDINSSYYAQLFGIAMNMLMHTYADPKYSLHQIEMVRWTYKNMIAGAATVEEMKRMEQTEGVSRSVRHSLSSANRRRSRATLRARGQRSLPSSSVASILPRASNSRGGSAAIAQDELSDDSPQPVGSSVNSNREVEAELSDTESDTYESDDDVSTSPINRLISGRQGNACRLLAASLASDMMSRRQMAGNEHAQAFDALSLENAIRKSLNTAFTQYIDYSLNHASFLKGITRKHHAGPCRHATSFVTQCTTLLNQRNDDSIEAIYQLVSDEIQRDPYPREQHSFVGYLAESFSQIDGYQQFSQGQEEGSHALVVV